MKPSSTTAAPKPSCAAVWAPWLAAPLFALLPVGGCGLAASIRPAAAHPPAAPAAAATEAPIVPVVTVADRRVAGCSSAH